MKKLSTSINIITVVIFTFLLLAGCNNDSDIEILPEGDYPLVFSASLKELKTIKSTSDNVWDINDEVAVKVGEEHKAYKSSSNGKLTSNDPFYWQTKTETKTLEAWYPYSNSELSSWTVKNDQSNEGLQQSDLIYAPAKTVSFAQRDAIELVFYHQTAKVVINIEKAEAATSTDIKKVMLGASDNMALSADYTPPEGTGITSGAWSKLSTMGTIAPKETSTASTGYLKSYAGLVIPQDMTGKKFIAVTLSNGKTYYYVPAGSDADLKGGKVYTYNITVKDGYLQVHSYSASEWTNEGTQNVESKEIKQTFSADELKPGDFFYRTQSDGSWVTSDGGLRKLYTDDTAEKKVVAPDNSKGEVLGIVFWVGDPTKGEHDNGIVFTDFGDPELKRYHSYCTHGLVVALQNAERTNWTDQSTFMKWPDDNPPIPLLYYISGFEQAHNLYGQTGPEPIEKLRGYNNSRSISDNWFYGESPLQHIDQWAESNLAPNNTSGWYLPCAKELSLLCSGDISNIEKIDGRVLIRDIVDSSISQITGATQLSMKVQYDEFLEYWSSMAYGESEVPKKPDKDGLYITISPYICGMDKGRIDTYPPTWDARYRAVLAF